MRERSANTTEIGKPSLGRLLSALRKQSGLSQSQLASKLHVSAPRLSQWEHDKRRPDQDFAQRLAGALSLSADQQLQLASAMGAAWRQRPKLHGRAEQLVEHIATQLADDEVSSKHRQTLIEGLSRTLQHWQTQRTQQVSAIVVPVAGWQAELLSDEQSARLIRAVVQEAKGAPLRRLIVIAAPRQRVRLVQRLKADPRLEGLSVVEVIQERPEGLGVAIRLAQPELAEGEAFLLSFPDERVLPGYTAALLAAHRRTQRNLIAVRRQTPRAGSPARAPASVGGVVLDAEMESDLLRIKRLEEKPTAQNIRKARFTILGRYVLNAGELFAALRDLPANQRTKKIELTDALNALARDGQVFGLPYNLRAGRLRSLRVPRQLMGKALDEFLAPLD